MTTIAINVYAYLTTWQDITSDCMSASADWGMKSSSPTDNLAQTGQLRLTLDNNTGRFTPGGASVIADDWGKGTKIKVVFTYDSQTWTRFYGSIDTIRIDAGSLGERKVHLIVLDWMNYAAKYPLNNPAIELEKRADEGITTILSGMPIQPLATELDTGAVTFPTIFNDATLKTKAYSEFSKFVNSELGSRIYVKKDKTYGETLRFESSTNRAYSSSVKTVSIPDDAGFLLQENGDNLLQENGDDLLTESYSSQEVTIDNTMSSVNLMYGDNLINRVAVSVNPTRIDTKDTQIFSIDSALYVDAGQEKSFFIQFTEENSKRLVSALPPESSYPTTLLHFDEGVGEELIVDEGGRPWDDFDCTLITSTKKVGRAALYLDGTDNYAEGTNSVDYEFGSGDFTVEWWEYRLSAAANRATISRSGAGGYVPWTFGYSDGTNSLVYITSNGSSWDIANGKSFGAITTNTWTHYAVVRYGDVYMMYKDGTMVQTWSAAGSVRASSSKIVIGKSSTNYLEVVIDEVRITKGLARYTANFTTTTEPYSLSGLVYAAWTKANGTGTELTGDFTVSVDYGAAGAEVTVSNNSAYAGWLSTLKIFGKLVETVSPVTEIQEDQESIELYGYNELSINQPYQADFTSGREQGAEILAINKKPLVSLERITMWANRDKAHTAYFLNTDVGDLVNIKEDQSEVDSNFYIQGMGWEAIPAGANTVVNYWWTVSEFRQDLSPLAIQFSADGSADDVEFGYIPHIAVENVPFRFISFWMKFNSTTVLSTNVLGNYVPKSGDEKGFSIDITSARKIIYRGGSGNSHGSWTTSSAAYSTTTGVWIHVCASYDSRSIVNNAKIYTNGSSLTVGAPTITGTIDTGEVGTNFVIGNPGLGWTSIKDLRIYNADQVADVNALALALYNEGAGGNENTAGLVFRVFNAPTLYLDEYVGANLTESQKIIDDIGLAVGTPKGAPLGESV